ncbi:MAG: peptidylprolyl isomerase [Chitinophagaceae bacterium]
MIRRIILFFFLLGIAGIFAFKANAQNYVYEAGDKPAADKIVAIIGDKIVLKSDLESMLVKEEQQYGTLPPNAACMILEQMLSTNALVLQAQIDSLPVSDDDVEQQLDQRINYFISLYGSQQKMEQIVGMSIYQIKEKFRKDIKDQMLAQAEQSKIVKSVRVTPTEVENYFNKIPKDSLPFFKSQVEVGQIVIKPKPDPAVVQMTINQLNDLRHQVMSGKQSFETLANLYSKDVATGGKILSIDRTQHLYDPQFVAAAFRLKNGEISPVFKSQFGYHIIQMVSREGNIAKVRHILLIPPVTSIDIQKAVKKLDTIRNNIVSGNLNFANAAVAYSDDDALQTANGTPGTKNTGGMFTMPDGSTLMNVNDLDAGIVLMLDTLKVGEVSEPQTYTPNPQVPDQQSVRLVYLKSRSKPHRENLQEDYSVIQAQALKLKQEKALSEWFNKHIPQFYLHIDPNYAQCGDLKNWVKDAQADGTGGFMASEK